MTRCLRWCIFNVRVPVLRSQDYHVTDWVGHALMYSPQGRAVVRGFLLEGQHQQHDYAFLGAASGIANTQIPGWAPSQMEGSLNALVAQAHMANSCGPNPIHFAIARFGREAWGPLFAKCGEIRLDDARRQTWDLEREMALILSRTGQIDEAFELYGVHNPQYARMLMRAICCNLIPQWNWKDMPCPDIRNVKGLVMQIWHFALRHEGKLRYEALATIRLLIKTGKLDWGDVIRLASNLPQLFGADDPQSHAWMLLVLRELAESLFRTQAELVEPYQALLDSFYGSVVNQHQMLALAGANQGLTPLVDLFFGRLADAAPAGTIEDRRLCLARYRRAAANVRWPAGLETVKRFVETFGGLFEVMLEHEAAAIAQLRRPLQYSPAAVAVEVTSEVAV